jgi:serine phosphatase RsbU (regulator of sigma subunit)
VPQIEHASFVRPVPGYRVGGDAAVVTHLEGGTFVAIIDALGHGPRAHDVAVRAEAFLREHANGDLVGLLGRLDRHLHGSIGAGAAVCLVDTDSGRLRYAGIGNTVIRRFGSREVRLVSRDGTLGAAMRTPREEEMHLRPGDVVVLYTDGVRSHFQLGEYPRLLSDGPQMVAQKVVGKFGKDHDDATCVVLRYLS